MAMISVLGIFAAEMATGKDAMQQFGLSAIVNGKAAPSPASFAGKTTAVAHRTVMRRAFQPSQQIGASEPLGFFDLLSSPAPESLMTACMPGVTSWRVARRCTQYVWRTLQSVMTDMFQGTWAVTSKERNKVAHVLNGNGPGNGKGGKSRGKGGGTAQHNAPVAAADMEKAFLEEIRLSLPEQARYRAQSTLVSEEWSVPPVAHQLLGPSGGVALCPKDGLAELLRRVSYTAHPCAILVAQRPEELGLKAYPCTMVGCTLEVATTGGGRDQVQVQRWLVQLGFGPEVRRIAPGTEIVLDTKMRRMSAKFSVHRGWAAGEHPSNILVTHLARYISEFAVDSVVARLNGTFTFLCHKDMVSVLLKASGHDGVFFKSGDDDPSFELLWLHDGATLDEALAMAKDSRVYGLAEKGRSGLLALRFYDRASATAFAKERNIPDTASLGRWKITGVPLSTGLHGLVELLLSLGWTGVDILFMDEKQAMVHATAAGDTAPLYYTIAGQAHPIQFKAVNAAAKEGAKAASQKTAEETRQYRYDARRLAQREFLRGVQTQKTPLSPRAVPEKRPGVKTGESPEPKTAK